MFTAYASIDPDSRWFSSWKSNSNPRSCEPFSSTVEIYFFSENILKNQIVINFVSYCYYTCIVSRFAINLQCGPNTNPRDDLALHFNVIMLERVIVRNSLIMGQWGQEERHCPTFPFLPGQGFEIVILADSHHYKVKLKLKTIPLSSNQNTTTYKKQKF